MPTVYPSLSIPAPRRLAMFRAEAAKGKWARPMTWRDVRFATLKSSSGLDQGLNDKTPIWYCHGGAQLRNERDYQEIMGRNHTGWFCDDYHNEAVIGIVAGLPHGRFLAGYRLTMSDERVYFGEIFDDESDAAHMADEHARVIAEQEREYQETEAARMAEEESEESLSEED